jgi:hypothetical protein
MAVSVTSLMPSGSALTTNVVTLSPMGNVTERRPGGGAQVGVVAARGGGAAHAEVHGEGLVGDVAVGAPQRDDA